MTTRKHHDQKENALRCHASLNPLPENVKTPLFANSDFFDKRDLVQVKYEMVRRVQVDGQSVTQSAAEFGFSRPSFYQAQSSLKQKGLAGLLGKQKGPRRSHKLSSEVMVFVQQELSKEPSLHSEALATRIAECLTLKVHPRSVERALSKRKKKQR